MKTTFLLIVTLVLFNISSKSQTTDNCKLYYKLFNEFIEQESYQDAYRYLKKLKILCKEELKISHENYLILYKHLIDKAVRDNNTFSSNQFKRQNNHFLLDRYKKELLELKDVKQFSDEELREMFERIEDVQQQEIFMVVEQMPAFPGGMGALMTYLATHIKYPALAKEEGIQGRVFINFVVEPDGSIDHVKVLRGIGGGCDEEAVRVVKSMPKWVPGKQRGNPVRVSLNLPVKFTLKK